jgi:hypothetical protein
MKSPLLYLCEKRRQKRRTRRNTPLFKREQNLLLSLMIDAFSFVGV